MNLQERITALAFLGTRLSQLTAEREEWAQEAYSRNKWFTPENIALAFKGIEKFLQKDVLEKWTSKYNFDETRQVKTVGVVMAGNIPMAGFHDMLSVLISGNKLMAKMSSQDPVLIKKLAELLVEIEPWFSDRIIFREKINEADAYIATGSDNTSRYFEYYFSKKPNIIRKNRSSIAILNGTETVHDIKELGKDIFSYFGLGCRSISHIYLPEGYDKEKLPPGLESFSTVVDYQKYGNNYEYNRALFLLKRIPYLDTGYLLLREEESIFTPVSVLNYSYYKNDEDLKVRIESHQHQIQVISSVGAWYKDSVDFGKTQQPDIWDYADNIDTLKFLTSI